MLHINKIEKEDHLFAAFSYFDKDGSGYITQDELQQACDQFGLGDVHLGDLIREIDKDNVNSLPDTYDLVSAIKKKPTVFNMTHVLHLFIFFQDGRIDYNEFVDMMQDTRWKT